MPTHFQTIMICLFICALLVSASVPSIHVFQSPATPLAVLSLLEDSMHIFHSFELTTIASPSDLLPLSPLLALDYLYNETLSLVLESYTAVGGQYIPMWGRSRKTDVWTYLHIYTKFAEVLNLTEMMVISDSHTEDLKVSSEAIDKYPQIYSQKAVLPENSDEDFCKQFVGRTIKPRGIRFLALFTDPISTYNLLSAFEAHKLNREGYVFLLSQKAGFYRYVSSPTVKLHKSGTLVVAEKAAQAETYYEFESMRLKQVLVDIASQDFSDQSAGNITAPQFFLFAMANYRLREIASSSETEIQHGSLLLPGNSSKLLPLSKPEISASVNYNLTEPDSTVFNFSLTVMRGFQVAFEDVNSRNDLIPDYIMRDNPVNFTGFTFDFRTTRDRVHKSIDKLGLIHMSPPFAQSVIGAFSVFQSLNLTVPITGSCMGSALSDIKEYPLYVRTRVSGEYVLMVMCRMILSFGWSRVAVLYQSDSGEMEDTYNAFVRLAEQYKIAIVNSEARRKTPSALSNSTSGSLDASILEIVDSTTRVIVIFSTFHYVILEQMYDLGIREEYLILLTEGLNDLIYSGNSSLKSRVVSKGALMFFPKLFVGSAGQHVKNSLIRYDKNSLLSNTCLYYDAAMLYFHATDFLLERGQDYEDPYLIVNTMRKTRFQGCSGVVQIDSGSNDRTSAEIAISNFVYDSETDKYDIRVIGTYNPYVSQPIQLSKGDIQWPDDSLSFTDYKPKYRNCDFLVNEVKSVFLGKIAGILICIFLGVVILLILLLLGIKTHFLGCEVLTSSHTISTEDVVFHFTVYLDLLALACLGPSTLRLKQFFSFLGAFAPTIFDQFLDSDGADFWTRYFAILSLSVWWILMNIMKARNINFEICLNLFLAISDFSSSFIANAFFIPIAVTFFQMFVCSNGVSDSFGSTFLDKDCSTRCWSGTHIVHLLVAGVVVVVYALMSIVQQLFKDNQREFLHIKQNFLAIVTKFCVKIVLIIGFVTIRSDYADVYAYAYVAVMVVYYTVMRVVGEFNYARLNLWAGIVELAVILLAIAAILSMKVSENDLKWILIALGGLFAVLIVLGIAIQCRIPTYGNRLNRQKTINIKYLLEFAFTGGSRASKALQNHYASNNTESNQTFSLYI